MHMSQATRAWTLAELHRLPDDGNKYELVHGELFVTPAPRPGHERILARLRRAIDPYVERNGLGVTQARGVVRFNESEVEPDLLVRSDSQSVADWEDAPIPVLVVEVLSDTTRRRDQLQKRDYYLEVGVADYWIIDPEQRTIRVIRPGAVDDVRNDTATWLPSGVATPFEMPLSTLFD
jgi:Uma2 family endonuclease